MGTSPDHNNTKFETSDFNQSLKRKASVNIWSQDKPTLTFLQSGNALSLIISTKIHLISNVCTIISGNNNHAMFELDQMRPGRQTFLNAPNTKVKVTAQDGDFTQWRNHHTKDQLDKVLVTLTAGLMTKLHHYKESHELSCE